MTVRRATTKPFVTRDTVDSWMPTSVATSFSVRRCARPARLLEVRCHFGIRRRAMPLKQFLVHPVQPQLGHHGWIELHHPASDANLRLPEQAGQRRHIAGREPRQVRPAVDIGQPQLCLRFGIRIALRREHPRRALRHDNAASDVPTLVSRRRPN